MVEDNNERPSSSTAVPPSKEDLDTINEILSAGKRHLVCNEPEQALDFFVQLCEKLSILYGQTADECAEAYLYYGKTLLELARLENGVLGHAVKEAPVLGPEGDDTETDTTQEKDDEELTIEKKVEIREKVEHAMRSGNLYNDATTEEDTDSEEQAPVNENKSSTKEKDGEGSSTKTEDSTTNSTEAQGTEKETDDTGDNVENVDEINVEAEEDVSNMELSWEMFELTCFICNRMIKESVKYHKKAKDMLAEAQYGLSQISMESEHYDIAIKDFTACLALYEEILEDKLDRRIAEVHYNIGLAFSFDKKFSEAIENFKKAVALLEERITLLQGKVKVAEVKSGKEKASPELEEWNKEINELKDLVLLDMMAKIEDSEEMKKQADESIKTIKAATKDMFDAMASATGFETGFDGGFEGGFDAPSSMDAEAVNDISHKIIRSSKVSTRKSDDDDSGVDAKKAKQVNGNSHVATEEKTAVNGDSSSHENGNDEKKKVLTTAA